MSNTKIKIYHGNQIGGCVVTIATSKASICIDFGENLPGSKAQENNNEILINGLNTGDKPKFNGVFFTHYHGDHVGRMKDILEGIPLYIGDTARKVLLTIARTVHDEEIAKILDNNDRIIEYTENETIDIEDIKITPFSVDHSAYDSYMFLIETPDKTILHTGDLRMHGYRGGALLDVIEKYVNKFGRRKVDILITEGTMMSRKNEVHYSEPDMQIDAIKLMREHKYIFLLCSSTNLDSLATFYQAGQAQIPRRKMFGSRYVLEQLDNFSETAGKRSDLYDFKNVEPVMFNYVTKLPNGEQITQLERMKKYGCVIVIKASEGYEKWIEKFDDCEEKPVIIYSMWHGYINPKCDAYDEKLDNFCKKYNAIEMHTSGHIYPDDLASLIEKVNPTEAIIPIHTEHAEGFLELEIFDELKQKIKLNIKEY